MRLVRAPSRRIYFVRLLHGRGVCRLASPRIVAAAITGAGDILSQLIIESHEQVDKRRLFVCTGLGGALDGAALQWWYSLLHKRLPGEHTFVVAQRLLLHQALATPLMVSVFIAATAALGAHAEPLQKVKHEWWPAMWVQWLVVAPAQALNFWRVPKHFQVLCANSCALAWSTGLSWLCHRPMAAPLAAI